MEFNPENIERVIRKSAAIFEGRNDVETDEIWEKVSSLYPELDVRQVDIVSDLVQVFLNFKQKLDRYDDDLLMKSVLLLCASSRGCWNPVMLGWCEDYSWLALKFLEEAKKEGMPDSFFSQLYDEDGSQRILSAFTTWCHWVDQIGCTVRQVDRYSWLSKFAKLDYSLEMPPLDVFDRFDDRSMLATLYFYKYFKTDIELLRRVVNDCVECHRSKEMGEFQELLKMLSKMYEAVK